MFTKQEEKCTRILLTYKPSSGHPRAISSTDSRDTHALTRSIGMHPVHHMHLLINNKKSTVRTRTAPRVYEFTNVPNVEHVACARVASKIHCVLRPAPDPSFSALIPPFVHDEPFTRDQPPLVPRYSFPGYDSVCSLPLSRKRIFVLSETRNFPEESPVIPKEKKK